MKNCPHCGEEVPDNTIYCRFCGSSLINPPRNPLSGGGPLLVTILMMVVLLLLIFLLGFSLFQLQPLLAGVFALIASLLLGFLAARGRYHFPNLRQYLFSMIIALVPVVGTLYSAFFAARYASESRVLRLVLLVALMLSLLLAALLNTDLGDRFNLGGLLARAQRSPTPSLTVAATTTRPGATATPRPGSTAAPTEAIQPTDTPEPPPVIEECMSWDQVSLDMVGQKVCVYGNYLNYYQKQDDAWVLAFSEDAGTFQVWSPAKRSMEMLLPRDGSVCVMVQGWLKTSGVRPIIIIGPQGEIGPCP